MISSFKKVISIAVVIRKLDLIGRLKLYSTGSQKLSNKKCFYECVKILVTCTWIPINYLENILNSQEEGKRKLSEAVKCTKEECAITAEAHLAEVTRKHNKEITELKTR